MTAKRRSPPAPHEPADRRHDLLEAAYRLIAEKGLEGLRTRDIAARAGVNISTLHYYFGTKEALLDAVVEHVITKFVAMPPPRARAAAPTVRTHLEGAWRTFEAEPHLSMVLQELVVRAQRNAASRAVFRGVYDAWNRLVEEIVRAGIAAGSVQRDLDPAAAARIVTSFIMGAMVQLGVNPKAFRFTDVARELEQRLAGGGD